MRFDRGVSSSVNNIGSVGACCRGLLRFPLVNSSSWVPNHVKGAVTRFLIAPRKDELWRTSFAGRHSLLEEDAIDDESCKAVLTITPTCDKQSHGHTHMFQRLFCSTIHRRTYSTQREAWLYIDSVFPIQIARWEYVLLFAYFTLF